MSIVLAFLSFPSGPLATKGGKGMQVEGQKKKPFSISYSSKEISKDLIVLNGVYVEKLKSEERLKALVLEKELKLEEEIKKTEEPLKLERAYKIVGGGFAKFSQRCLCDFEELLKEKKAMLKNQGANPSEDLKGDHEKLEELYQRASSKIWQKDFIDQGVRFLKNFQASIQNPDYTQELFIRDFQEGFKTYLRDSKQTEGESMVGAFQEANILSLMLDPLHAQSTDTQGLENIILDRLEDFFKNLPLRKGGRFNLTPSPFLEDNIGLQLRYGNSFGEKKLKYDEQKKTPTQERGSCLAVMEKTRREVQNRTIAFEQNGRYFMGNFKRTISITDGMELFEKNTPDF